MLAQDGRGRQARLCGATLWIGIPDLDDDLWRPHLSAVPNYVETLTRECAAVCMNVAPGVTQTANIQLADLQVL